MRVKDNVTAAEIVAGAKVGTKIRQYKVRLVKDKDRLYAVRQVSSSTDLAAICRAELGNLPHEEIIVIGLSVRNEPLGIVKVSQGGQHGAAVLPGDILRPLVLMGAAAFVIAHNHPSGDPTASEEDIRTTRVLQKAASCANIPLLDHVIIAGRGGNWTSMRDTGIIS